mgnify:CR=1 FL=1
MELARREQATKFLTMHEDKVLYKNVLEFQYQLPHNGMLQKNWQIHFCLFTGALNQWQQIQV